jgi:hypothetical protein
VPPSLYRSLSRTSAFASAVSLDTASTSSLFFSPRSLLHTTASNCPALTVSPTWMGRVTSDTAWVDSEPAAGTSAAPSSTTSPANRA